MTTEIIAKIGEDNKSVTLSFETEQAAQLFMEFWHEAGVDIFLDCVENLDAEVSGETDGGAVDEEVAE